MRDLLRRHRAKAWLGGTARAAGQETGAAGDGRGLSEAIAQAERCSRNFTEYEEWRKHQLGDAALRPHRIAYRRLTR